MKNDKMMLFVKFDVIVFIQAASIASVIGGISDKYPIRGSCLCTKFPNTPVRTTGELLDLYWREQAKSHSISITYIIIYPISSNRHKLYYI